jgi:thiamine biosynthesis protein ThiS
MKLRLNGSLTEFRDNATVSELLKELKIEPRGVAVEVNLEIVKKQDYHKRILNDGDSVEIVKFVGGG